MYGLQARHALRAAPQGQSVFSRIKGLAAGI